MFFFTPTWGRFPIWRAYFSNGLKPTREELCFFLEWNGLDYGWSTYPPTVPPSEIKGFRRASEENTKGQWAMIGWFLLMLDQQFWTSHRRSVFLQFYSKIVAIYMQNRLIPYMFPKFPWYPFVQSIVVNFPSSQPKAQLFLAERMGIFFHGKFRTITVWLYRGEQST